MEDYNVNLLNDKFNLYYDAARKAHKAGKIQLAKKNYMLAAETMLKLAKLSTPELKTARVERAKRIIALAENIKAEPQTNENANGSRPQGQNQNANGEEGKSWEAAEIPNIHFSDIAGLEDVKKAIITRMINPIKYPEKYAAYDKKTGGGLLLYGPPGTGKTMIAKAIACEVGAKFYAIKGSDVVSKWVGESEKNISSLFETARQDPLAIIFIDEMDSLIGKRGVDIHNDKRVNEFLQQIDGFVGRNPNLLLLGATNRPWDIDSAAMRSGRFSQKVYVPLPDAKAREFLFNKYIKKAPVADDVDIKKLVYISDGYSGADIDEICDRAKENPLLKAIKSNDIVKISMNDFIYAFRQVPPSVDKNELKRFEEYTGSRQNKNIGDITKVDDIPMDFVEPEDFTPIENGDSKIVARVAPEVPKVKVDLQVEFATDSVKIKIDEPTYLECYISDHFDVVSMKIASNNYVCSNSIRNWKTEPLDIAPGTYMVEVYGDGKKIAQKEITFSKGIEENNDFDI